MHSLHSRLHIKTPDGVAAGWQVLMEAALALSRGVPRAYLLPSPHQRQPDAQLTFRPQITQKSKVTPFNLPLSHLLVSQSISQSLNESVIIGNAPGTSREQ